MSQLKFSQPPINEVVCGLKFSAVPGLDAVTMGFYAKERENEYPGHEVQPPIGMAGGVFSSMPIRIWLISANDEFVLQLQNDRFYVNWRARGAVYPKFSGEAGILPKLRQEFERFSQFCERQLGQRPDVSGLELAKIDQIPEGVYWQGLEDGSKLVPWLGSTPRFCRSANPLIGIRVVDGREGGKLSVQIDLGTVRSATGETIRTVKLESRIERDVKGDVEAVYRAFSTANDEVNEVFEAVIPEDEALKRFNP